MAKMNGCNEGMCAPAGKNSTRMQPIQFARNNLVKGGVNQSSHGGKGFPHKPAMPAGKAKSGC